MLNFSTRTSVDAPEFRDAIIKENKKLALLNSQFNKFYPVPCEIDNDVYKIR